MDEMYNYTTFGYIYLDLISQSYEFMMDSSVWIFGESNSMFVDSIRRARIWQHYRGDPCGEIEASHVQIKIDPLK